MELAWERQQPIVDLSIEDGARLLEGSGFAPVHLDPIQEGLANTNYRVEAEDGTLYHLRLLQRDPSGLSREVALNWLVAGKVPTPRVVFSDPERQVILSEWVEGVTLQRSMASGDGRLEEVAFDAGRVLARIASFKFDSAGIFGGDLEIVDSWPSTYDGLSGYVQWVAKGKLIGARLATETRERVLAAWRDREPDLRAAMDEPCLSHADFKPSNLLVEDGRIAAVLDWEFAHAGTWLTDAGQFLRYLGEDRPAAVHAFEKGLKKGGIEPPPDWDLLARVVDLASLCDFMNRPKLGEDQAETIRGLIEDSLTRL
jgi:aminoglycoside phosphotransferase (APT) family kinase protein